MKIGFFTDAHYSSQEVSCGCRFHNRSLAKIKEALAEFKSAGVELVICLGDLTDSDISHQKVLNNLGEITEALNASGLPAICLMGNHDAFDMTEEEFYSVLGPRRPQDFRAEGKNFIFIDACYFKSGRRYMPGDSDWTDTFCPESEQLRKKLAEAEGDCYILMHQNVDPAAPSNHRLFNADELCRIFEESGKVKTVFQGHFHRGCRNELGGVKYITFPAMVEQEKAYFIMDI